MFLSFTFLLLDRGLSDHMHVHVCNSLLNCPLKMRRNSIQLSAAFSTLYYRGSRTYGMVILVWWIFGFKSVALAVVLL